MNGHKELTKKILIAFTKNVCNWKWKVMTAKLQICFFTCRDSMSFGSCPRRYWIHFIIAPVRILCFDKDQRIRMRYETMKRDYEIPNRRPILNWQTYLIWRTCSSSWRRRRASKSYLTCYDDALTKAFRKLSIDLAESVS